MNYEIKFYSRDIISDEYNCLQKLFKNAKIPNYLNYSFALNDGANDMYSRINKDKDEIEQNTKKLEIELKTAEDISSSFDEILTLFYDIQKHKKEKKIMKNQFGSKMDFQSSVAANSSKNNFFVSKFDSSADQFSSQLSLVVDEFFNEYLSTGVGILPLIDAFIEFNKHRGLDIVSSRDFFDSCSKLNKSNST